eukprot:IDg4670t1
MQSDAKQHLKAASVTRARWNSGSGWECVIYALLNLAAPVCPTDDRRVMMTVLAQWAGKYDISDCSDSGMRTERVFCTQMMTQCGRLVVNRKSNVLSSAHPIPHGRCAACRADALKIAG